MSNNFLPFPAINVTALTQNLKPETTPLWGTLVAQQMIEHMSDTMMISIGVINVRVYTEFDKVEKIKQLFIDSDMPLRKNFKAPVFRGDGITFRNNNLQVAIEELSNYVEKFISYYIANEDAKHNHPVFGLFAKKDWEQFHGKHFTHHFSQFGLV